MLSVINSNKILKVFVYIVSIPVLSLLFTIFVKLLFDFGVYFGTFVRNIYEIIVC